MQKANKVRGNSERYLISLLSFLASGCLGLLVLILGFLLMEAWPAFSDGNWRAFYHDQGWYPLEGMLGITPMIWASLAIALGAVLLALPLGIASAIFLQFYAQNFMAKAYRLLINLLAGIPSVIYGLWGLMELVPLLTKIQPPGVSLLAAILVLALMILPTIALTSSSALAAVSNDVLKGASALGLTNKTKILAVAIPAAKGGIASGVVLAVARALGETMAVLMVAGNVVQNPTGLLEPVRSLTANIALEIAYATGQHRASLFASGLLLILLVFVLAWFTARRLANNKAISQHV